MLDSLSVTLNPRAPPADAWPPAHRSARACLARLALMTREDVGRRCFLPGRALGRAQRTLPTHNGPNRIKPKKGSQSAVDQDSDASGCPTGR